MTFHTECHKTRIVGEFSVFNIIAENNSDAVTILEIMFLASKIAINDKIDSLNNTALHFAVYKNRERIVKFLLALKPDHNARNIDDDTPLNVAIKHNNILLAELLLENGSSLSATNIFGLTSFMISVQYSNINMTKFLMKYTNDIHMYSRMAPHSLTPMELAISFAREDVVQLLINNGIDVNRCSPGSKHTLLHNICVEKVVDKQFYIEHASKLQQIFEMLIKAGADLNAVANEGETPLLLAIKSNEYILIEMLVKNGCNLNIPFPKYELGRTPLHLAVLHPKWEKLLDLFLRFGADYKKADVGGITPYHCSLFEATNKLQIAQTFWKYGCPYDLPFEMARFSERITFYKKNYGKNFESVFRCQKLMFQAIRANNVKRLECALKIGAIVRGTSVDMKYPLHFVTSKGYNNIAKLLLEKGIKVNSLNSKKESTIQLAVKCKQVNICKLLLRYGAYVNYEEEIVKLKKVNEGPGKEIKDLFKSIYMWFKLVKFGDIVVIRLMKDMLETDKEMFLIHVNALDKNRRSLMSSAIYYKRKEIVEEIMKNRINYTLSLTHE